MTDCAIAAVGKNAASMTRIIVRHDSMLSPKMAIQESGASVGRATRPCGKKFQFSLVRLRHGVQGCAVGMRDAALPNPSSNNGALDAQMVSARRARNVRAGTKLPS